MARGARVGNSRLFGFDRGDKTERVRRNVAVFNGLLNQGHVACGALTPTTVFGVMSMPAHSALESCRVAGGVASEAEGIAPLSQV